MSQKEIIAEAKEAQALIRGFLCRKVKPVIGRSQMSEEKSGTAS